MDDQQQSNVTRRILAWSNVGKRIIAGALLVMMFVVVTVLTLQMLYAMVAGILPGGASALSWLEASETRILEILGLLLTVLIALELIETVEVYFHEHAIHVEAVVLVAIIAIARKVILLDPAKYSPLLLMGLGLLVIALGATYYLVRRAGQSGGRTSGGT